MVKKKHFFPLIHYHYTIDDGMLEKRAKVSIPVEFFFIVP